MSAARDYLKDVVSLCDIPQNVMGIDFVREMAKKLSQLTGMPFVVLGRPSEENKDIINTKCVWANDSFADNFSYELEGTPCQKVLDGKRTSVFKSNVAKDFPKDMLLEQMGIESYAGAPIIDQEGNLYGLLILMSNVPISNPDEITLPLDYCANHLAVDLMRSEVETKLVNINTELKDAVLKSSIKLRDAQDQLFGQEKYSLLGKVISGVSHELKNPLNIIYNMGEVIRENINTVKTLDKEDDVEGIYTEIEEITNLLDVQTRRMNDVINIMISQVRENQKDKKEFELSTLIDENLSISYHAQKALNGGTSINVNSPHDEQKVRAYLTNDFSSALLNIFENAFYSVYTKHKYNLEEGQIKVDLDEDANNIYIEIYDNGTGIPQENISEIFDPFFTTKAAGEGIGLGLTLAKNVIETNRGKIEIDTKENEYTKLTIKLRKS